MTGINVDWALKELDLFIEMTVMRNGSGGGYITTSDYTSSPDEQVAQQAVVIEQILNRVIIGWQSEVSDAMANNRWARHREACIRARVILLRENEIRENLGDDSPEITASQLHRWVWSGASSLWKSGHYRQAVEDALKKVNAETQNKVGRRDISETSLFVEVFSEKSPEPGRPRLRRIVDDGSDTFKSVHRGARSYAEGLYAGIRNPFGHGDPDLMDIDAQMGLEYLAAVSVLARWVDDAIVEARE